MFNYYYQNTKKPEEIYFSKTSTGQEKANTQKMENVISERVCSLTILNNIYAKSQLDKISTHW